MNVANSTPKPSETAIGTMNAASKLGFHISGGTPKKAVSDVSRSGRKRWTPASRTTSARPADSNGPPVRRAAARLPRHPSDAGVDGARPVDEVDHDQAVVDDDAGQRDEPDIDIIDTSRPRRMCPQTAPMRPNGTALMMISGCT